MELEIILAKPSDATDIEELEKECFSKPWTKENIIESLENSTIFFVAKLQNKTVGYCGMQNALGDGYITNVAVTKTARGKGVATRLLKALFSFAETNKLNFISLEVRKSNIPAIYLYNKMGFEDVGTRKNFYSDPREDAIIMTKYFLI